MIALRLSWLFARSAAAGAIVALVLAAAVPVVFGGRTFTVMSGSMEPNVSTGDMVLTVPIAPGEAASGDIVTFTDPSPSGHGRLLTHRVARSARRGETYSFVTKGDANTNVERWTVPADGRIGRVVMRIPKLGYAMAISRKPAARVALVALPALLLAGFALAAIWRKEEEDAPAPA
jgi:signal peptidase I